MKKRNAWLTLTFFVASLMLLALTIALSSGCTSAYRSKVSALGVDHTVKLYSGGEMVGTWTSNGVVRNEDGSDGFYFTDKETGKLVRVSGTLVFYPE